MTIYPVFHTYDELLVSLFSTEQAAIDAVAHYNTVFAPMPGSAEDVLLQETGQECYFVGESHTLDLRQEEGS